MPHPKLSIDFDDVLYKLHPIMLDTYEKIYGITHTPKDITHWHFFDFAPEITDIWQNFHLYKSGGFFDNDIAFIDTLRKSFDIQIVTHSHPNIVSGKDKMIKDRYGDIKVFHTHESKSFYTKNSILIDDALHNIECHINTNNMPAIIVDRGYGWNQNFQDHHLVERAHCFDTILEKVHLLQTCQQPSKS